MEIEEQTRVQDEWEEEVEEAALLVRKSKPSNIVNITINVSANGKSNNGENGSIAEHVGTNRSFLVEEEPLEESVDPFTTLIDQEFNKTPTQNCEQQKSENVVYYDKDEGENFISLLPGEEFTNENTALEKQNGTSEIISVEKTPTQEILHDDHSASYKSSSIKEIESEDVSFIEETDPDVADIDLAKVLQKQNTHDLFCPNCNSCITRRVILRKRKRSIRNLSEEEDVKRTRPHINVEINDTLNNSVTKEDPDVFRCLSCFSFFIPNGDGFKLFRSSSRKDENSTTQDTHISETNTNWFSSFFKSNKGKKEEKAKDETEALISSTNITVSSVQILSGTTKPVESAVPENATTNLENKLIETILSHQDEAAMDNFEAGTDHIVTNREHAVSATRQDGQKLLISSEVGPSILEKFHEDQKNHDDESMIENLISNGKEEFSVEIPQDYEQRSETRHVTKTEVEDSTSTYKVSNEDGFFTNQISTHTTTTTETNFQTGKPWIVNSDIAADIASVASDTIIIVEAEPTETEASERAPLLGAQGNVVEPIGIRGGERYGIEILKSIVYGGLVESITSLSVVSSAAGGGASTLNTVALGMANLIGGIFFIIHNLYQLKNDQEDQAINQVSERVDQYRELLGRRKNFVLHAVVAMLSYLIFGLLPPIIYGFSFRKSDDRDLKLVIVAAASFVCILVLAIAKGYVRRQPNSYLGIVSRYIVLGIMVSGVSYVAGELFNRLLENLGLFETSSVPEMTPKNQVWSSF